MAHKASDTTNGSRGRTYLSRFAFHAIPGKTGEVETELEKLAAMVAKDTRLAGINNAPIFRSEPAQVQ
jgi:hypothetical protein